MNGVANDDKLLMEIASLLSLSSTVKPLARIEIRLDMIASQCGTGTLWSISWTIGYDTILSQVLNLARLARSSARRLGLL